MYFSDVKDVVFSDGHPLPLFNLFPFFSNFFLQIKQQTQQDLNLDCRVEGNRADH